MQWILYVLSPVLVHLVITEIIEVLAGEAIGSAACTLISALIVLPAAIVMYRMDGQLHGESQAVLSKNIGESPKSTVKLMKFAGMALLGLFSGALLNVIWSGILNALHITSYFSNEAQEGLFAADIVIQILGPGLMVPVTEEMIFRGLVYTRMKVRLKAGYAVVLSALLFALYHGNPIQMIYAFPMAVALALFYEKGGSLIFPVLFHMGANLIAIAAQITV